MPSDMPSSSSHAGPAGPPDAGSDDEPDRAGTDVPAEREQAVTPTEARAGTPETASLDLSQRVIPSHTDPLAEKATTPLGGPLGEHAAVGRHWFWSPLRVGLLLGVLALMLSWFGKAACIQQYEDSAGNLQLDWQSNRQYVAMCYSDIVPLYSAERLDRGDTFPYVTHWSEEVSEGEFQRRYMEYPVLTGLFQWGNAKLTHGWVGVADKGLLPGALPVAVYFNITALFLAAAWLTTIWATARIARRRPWDAVLVAISPLIIVHAFTNFDTVAVALATCGLLAWARRRPVVAGVLLGLGAAAKLYPLFLLGPLLVLCVRAGRIGDWARTTLATAGTWLAVNLPFLAAFTEGWREFFRLNTERAMDPDSIYNVISHFTGWAGFDGPLEAGETPNVLNTVSGALFLLGCLAVAYVALTAPRRPRLAQLCFLVVAVFLLTNKVWSPQYSLWLVPLAVLAIPRWRLLLSWMLVDALVWAPRMLSYVDVSEKGLPDDWFLGTVVVRDLMVVALCVLIVREIYRPSADQVRCPSGPGSGDDDPLGGVLSGSRDAVVLPGLSTLVRRRPARTSPSSPSSRQAGPPVSDPPGAGRSDGR
ncbi:glycosyltransferase family 87 protein [Prauserella aidingensis]|uniref:glycosyltransferase family 87 protein n=1 Tax=Prauserella aidingensis TaxID=387890 RepID=UPI0020A4D5A1|nr:glycosyltransferase 87 family protein [Prauserella aidingensis]